MKIAQSLHKILGVVIGVAGIIWLALFLEKLGGFIGLWDTGLLHPLWGNLLLAFGLPDDSILGYLLVRYASFVALGFWLVVSGVHRSIGFLLKVHWQVEPPAPAASEQP